MKMAMMRSFCLALLKKPDASEAGQDLVNINTASAEELDNLPGIGPTIAQRIVEYREANGSFQTIDDLMNVSGIGPSTFENIKELIST
ncbi:MAG: helix-hairpin-helix domain-containing protein [Anaerolineales bacterium]|nr:helix-hairpin-helix domain-containing protein [Anaerolineales bacterium]